MALGSDCWPLTCCHPLSTRQLRASLHPSVSLLVSVLGGHGVWQHTLCQRKGLDLSEEQRQRPGLHTATISAHFELLRDIFVFKVGVKENMSQSLDGSPSHEAVGIHMPCSPGGPWTPAMVGTGCSPVATRAFWSVPFHLSPLRWDLCYSQWQCLANLGWHIFGASSRYLIAKQTCSS